MNCFTILHDSLPYMGITATPQNRIGNYGNVMYVDFSGKYIPTIVTPVPSGAHVPVVGGSYLITQASIGEDGESLVGQTRSDYSLALVYWHILTNTSVGDLIKFSGKKFNHIIGDVDHIDYEDHVFVIHPGGYLSLIFETHASLRVQYQDSELILTRKYN